MQSTRPRLVFRKGSATAECSTTPYPQVLWPKDMFTGGNRGCRDGSDARLMRALLHAMHGTKLPPAGAAPPATITLQRKSANRRILNEGEVVDMLREFGEVGGCHVGFSFGMWSAAAPAGGQLCTAPPPHCPPRSIFQLPPPLHLTIKILVDCRCEWWSLTPAAACGSSWRWWQARESSFLCTPATWPTRCFCRRGRQLWRYCSATGPGRVSGGHDGKQSANYGVVGVGRTGIS